MLIQTPNKNVDHRSQKCQHQYHHNDGGNHFKTSVRFVLHNANALQKINHKTLFNDCFNFVPQTKPFRKLMKRQRHSFLNAFV